MKKRGLAVTTILTLAFGLGGLVLYRMKSTRPYISIPGNYVCEGFGLPNADSNRLRIEGDFRVVGEGKNTVTEAGKLVQKNDTQGSLDISMDLVHNPKFNLDPFTPMTFEGVGSGLQIKYAIPNQGTKTANCTRM